MNGVRDAQQQRVLEVAIELFAEHGFDDVTMSEIAEAADVARATVFNYFGSKHGLVETVTETVIVFYREMLDEALVEEHMPAPEQLRTLYAEMGKGIEAHRRLFRSVFREIARIGLGLDEGSVAQRANDEALTRLRALIARGQAHGEINDAFDPMTLATAFRSLANGTITNWLYEDATDSLVARMREAADIFLSAVEQPARAVRRTRQKGGSR
jgi:AcrR family transcriptional regulator